MQDSRRIPERGTDMRRVASALIVVLLSLVGSLVAAAPAGAAVRPAAGSYCLSASNTPAVPCS